MWTKFTFVNLYPSLWGSESSDYLSLSVYIMTLVSPRMRVTCEDESDRSNSRLNTSISAHGCHPFTPSLVGRQCWGKTILPGAGYGLGTYRTVDIFNFSHFSCPILEKLHFLCFYIIKSIAQNTPKSDFRGSKVPPRGASSTWNM